MQQRYRKRVFFQEDFLTDNSSSSKYREYLKFGLPAMLTLRLVLETKFQIFNRGLLRFKLNFKLSWIMFLVLPKKL